MGWIAFIFWTLLGGVFFAYAGYPLLLAPAALFRRRRAPVELQPTPALTLVIAAYNEAAILPQKIQNSLALHYPPGLMRMLVVADGSTDNTAAALAPYPQVQLLLEGRRLGKTAALNRAMPYVQTPFVVFSDANTLLNPEALLALLRHFGDANVGAVAGEKRVQAGSGMGFAEGWYWHYESWMKRIDADFHSVVGAAGELFALRTELFTALPEDTILDDLALSLQVGMRGYRIGYEPGAFALEAPSTSLRNEKSRKVRIAAGAFQLLHRLSWKSLLRHPALAFQFLVRRWMRWVFCPLALPLLFLSNGLLAYNDVKSIYGILFAGQLMAYLLAAAGALLLRRNRVFFLTTIPFYFLFMNWCMLAGWRRYRGGKQSVLWEKAR